MSDLSTVAERIADYAISIAKRNDNESAGSLHVLAAIRRWQPERFDQRFPTLNDRLEAALRRRRGQAIGVTGLAEEARHSLGEVRSNTDVWDLAERLAAAIESDLDDAGLTRAGASTSDSAATTSTDAGGSASTEASGVPERATQVFPITESLVARVGEILETGADVATARLLQDATAVARRILGEHAAGIESQIADASQLQLGDLPDGSSLSSLVHEISVCPHSEAGKVATQVALALVEVAEWSAVLDETVTREETDRIDEIRLELRAQLGDRLDAESPAIEEFERKFDGLIGMTSVKAELRRRIDFLVVSKRRRRQGHHDESHRMHMAFVGNPGTGKTTVARLYGELLNDLGLLPSRTFIETDRSGLVGEYVGHTESKTMRVIESADGGVLFIDEVYALQDHYGVDRKGFGEEATDILVKQMEDRRERLVVVIAGYRAETLQFMSMNPGLKSRIPMIVDFPDYDRSDLAAICRRIGERSGLIIEDEAVHKIADVLDAQRSANGFGHARAVENLLEAARRNAVSRVSDLGNLATERELSTVVVDDVPATLSGADDETQRRRIGYI